MHFDLTDLRLFLNTLDSGNITAGAQRSHLSLAAASTRIRAHEASLGTALFERGRRGVTPTAAGLALGRHSRQVLQHIEHMQFELAQYSAGIKGRLHLACNSAALTEHLPEPLAEFLKRYPTLELEVSEWTSTRIVQALREGTLDLGIVSNAVDMSGLQSRRFRVDPLLLVIPQGHLLQGRQGLGFADTLEHGFVGLPAHSALGQLVATQAAQLGHTLQVRVRAGSLDGVLRMVALGAGLGIVPRATQQRWQGTAALQWLPLPEPWAARELWICARDFAALPGYAQGLLAILDEYAPAVSSSPT